MASKNPFLAGIREDISDLKRELQGVVVTLDNKADRSELPPPAWPEEDTEDSNEEYSYRLYKDLSTIVDKLNEICSQLSIRGLQWSDEERRDK